MFYLIDNQNKIIFGLSTKCGCSHVKRIFVFLTENKENIKNIHNYVTTFNKLPNDIANYTTIIISRNPYKRIISGFLDKYKIDGEFRHLWKYRFITFSMFINELVKNNWKMIENNHFAPQIADDFNENILNSKSIKCYDIENINYKYIESLYGITIPDSILQKKEGHERKNYDTVVEYYVYDLYMITYLNYNVDIKYFYNEELKKKVFDFYKNDFIFFSNIGIDYITTTF